MYTEIQGLLICIVSFIDSNLFRNIIALISMIIALIVLNQGSKKISDVISEYKKKKANAIISYHLNIKYFIHRLKRLISTDQDEPSDVLYLYSSNEELRESKNGYKTLAEELRDLSLKFLDYLSTKSDQVPAGEGENHIDEWNSDLDCLVNYLASFLLYNSGAYLPNLNSQNEIKIFHNDLNQILNRILKSISKDMNRDKNERAKSQDNSRN